MRPVKGTPEYEEWNRLRSAKISASMKGKPKPWQKGRPPYNKGVPLSEKQKAILLVAHKGKKQRPETIAKRVEKLRGQKRSPEFCAQMGDLHRGKTLTDAHRAAVSLARKTQPGNFTGRIHTLETREKLAQASLNRWNAMTEEQQAAKLELMRNASKDITKSLLEEIVALELDAQGIVYERQKRIGWYSVDFYIASENRIIEANGCYWHGCESCGYNKEQHQEKRLKDAKRYEYLRRKGYILEIIWEHDRSIELRRLRRKG